MNLKRIISLVLALTMIFTLAFPGGIAFADDEDAALLEEDTGSVEPVGSGNDNDDPAVELVDPDDDLEQEENTAQQPDAVSEDETQQPDTPAQQQDGQAEDKAEQTGDSAEEDQSVLLGMSVVHDPLKAPAPVAVAQIMYVAGESAGQAESFTDLATALQEAGGDHVEGEINYGRLSTEVTLLASPVSIDRSVALKQDVVLDLNDKTLTLGDDLAVSGGSLTIRGTGTLTGYKADAPQISIANGYYFEDGAVKQGDQYTVTFDSAGGSPVASQPVVHGRKAARPADPTRPGYTFDGWYDGSLAWNFDTPIAENKTLTAQWTILTYTIGCELALEGAALPEGKANPETYTVESDEITLVNPFAAEKYFAGWTGTDLTEATETVSIPKGSTGNRTYTATWGNAAASVNGRGCKTFADAAAARVSNEDVITLLANAEYTMQSGETLKVKKGGFELTVSAPSDAAVQANTEEDVTTYELKAAAAEVNGVGFATLAEAVDAAAAGSTVTLLQDIELTATQWISKDLVLDLGGKTITGNTTEEPKPDRRWITVDSGTVTIQNGTIKGRVNAYDDADLTLGSDLAINGQVVVWGDGEGADAKTPTLTVNGKITNTGDWAISTNGTDKSGANIIIQDGAIVTSDDIAVYLPSGNLKVTGGSITGATAVYVKSGSAEITGGTLNGTGTAAEYSFNGNGGNATGDALVVDNCGYPNGEPTVTVSGGTFSSTNGKAIGSYAYGAGDDGEPRQLAEVRATTADITTREDQMWLEKEDGGYELVEAVTVTFDAAGGNFGKDDSEQPITIKAVKIKKGTTVTKPAATWENHGLTGWVVETEDSETHEISSDKFDFDTQISENTTLKAEWTAEYEIILTPPTSIKVGSTGTLNVTITKNDEPLGSVQAYSAEKENWELIVDEDSLEVTRQTAYKDRIAYTLKGLKAGTTTVTYRNIEAPDLCFTAEVTINHNLTVTFANTDISNGNKGVLVEAGPVAIISVKLDGVEVDRADYTFTSEDETIVTVDSNSVTPIAAGTTYINVTLTSDQEITVRKFVKTVDAVAQIGDKYYKSISDAMNAAASGDTVTLCRNVTESVLFTGSTPRRDDFTLTIDLNGHTWNGADNASYALRTDYGIVTVQDSVGGGGITYGRDFAFIVSHLAGDYPSKLILESGTFTGKSSVVQVGYPGGNGANYKYYGGDLVVNGGTFVTVPDTDESYDSNGHFRYTLNMLDMNQSAYAGGIYSPSTITVNGGAFANFDPENNAAEGPDTNFTAAGHISFTHADDDAIAEGFYVVKPGCVVTFDVDGDTTKYEPQRVVTGGRATKPAPDPTKADYAFKEWQLVGSAFDFDNTTITEDITLKAAWSEPIAKIGETNYATLQEAVDAAADNDTVVLLKDLSESTALTSRVEVSKSITIDLGGHSIVVTHTTGNGSAFDIVTGTVEIKNGTIDGTGVQEGEGSNIAVGDGICLVTVRSGATLNLTEADGEKLHLIVNSRNGCCVYPFVGGTVNISGGTYENQTAEEYQWKAGFKGLTVNQANDQGQLIHITGGTFIGNDPQLGDDSNGAHAVEATFVAMPAAGTTAGQSGTYSVVPGGVVTFDVDGDTTRYEAQRVAAGDGRATRPAEDPAKADYLFKEWQLDGSAFDFANTPITEDITLKAAWSEPIAKIGETNYATLQEAVDAAADNDTVVLLKDLSESTALTSRVEVSKSITIDLGGHSIVVTHTTGNGSAFNIVSGTVEIKNGTIDGTGVQEGEGSNIAVGDGICLVTVRSGATLNLTEADGEKLHLIVNSRNGCCVYPFAGGTVNISGGTYENQTTEEYQWKAGFKGLTINQANDQGQLIHITGGTFIGNDPQLGDDSNGARAVEATFVAMPAAGTTGGQSGTYSVVPGGVVTFDVDGDTTRYEAQRVAAGDGRATRPAVDPTKADYAFKEWQLDSDAFDFANTQITENITLKAAWYDAVASITTSAGTTFYATVQEAVDAAQDNETVVILADGLTFEQRVDANTGKTITIDLNGKKLLASSKAGNGSIFNIISGNVTIKNGTLDGSAVNEGENGLTVANGICLVTVRSGATLNLVQEDAEHPLHLIVNSRNGCCVYPFAGGTVNISGGTYENKTTEEYQYKVGFKGLTVNQANNQGQLIHITGGTFIGNDPQLGDDSNGARAVEAGYVAIPADGTSVNENGNYTVEPGYIVTFDTNGGEPETVTEQRVREGEMPTKPDAPTKDDVTFIGWYNGDTEYEFDTPLNADTELTAHWNATVTFRAMGGKFSDGTELMKIEVSENGKIDEAAWPTVTRENFVFDSWTDLNHVAYTKDSEFAKNITLVAIWNLAEFTVTFDSAGGTSVEKQTVVYSKHAVRPGDPVREGYTFDGWFEGSAETAFAFETSEIKADTTLTAHWTANEYAISYDLDGGALGEGISNPTGYTIESAFTLNNPTKEGYTFAGWTGTGLTEATTSVSVAAGSTGERSYTATWTANAYSITWNNDDSTEIDTTTVNYGEMPTHADAVKAPDAQYTYIFAGWTPEITAVTGNATYTATYTDIVNEYTVKFMNEDGTELQSKEVAYGETPAYTGATPTKQGDAQYSYTFAGWMPEIAAVSGEATYTATYTDIVNEYTVKFVNEDGTELQSKKVAYGETPAYTGETPTKEATAQYSYTFAGWTPEIAAVSGEATYTATYTDIVNEYTVKFVNEDGKELQSSEVAYGETPAYTGETPTKEATAQYSYTFAGWTPEIAAVSGDATYTATYTETVNEYTIKFVNADGTVLQSGMVKYGDIPAYTGTMPTKAADAQYSYTFKGWTPAITAVSGDATYTAEYDSTANKYTIRFVNEGDTELQSKEVAYGETPAYTGATPTKQGDAQYSYTFAGWNPEIAAVTGEATYTATYTDIVNEYTVKFVDEDGTELQSGEVAYGETPTYTGETPEKEATAQYSYTFAGWTPEIAAVSGDATYTATYSETVNEYAVKFVDADGTELQSTMVAFGTMPTAPTDPHKEATAEYSYTFKGWEPEIVSVSGEVTYTAAYTETVNEYTIKFVNADGTELQSGMVKYGDIPAYIGTMPTKAADAQYSYTFKGWTPAITAVSGEATYTAEYESTTNKYTIRFVNEGDTELQSKEVAYGETPAYTGATPTKQGDAQYSYTFAGWMPEIAAVSGEATYTATYTDIVNEYTVKFVDEDGTELQSKIVAYGETPAYTGEAPTKEATAQYSYSFKSWTPEIAAVSGDATYTATYTETVNEYTVKFVDADGTELHSTEVEYGTLVAAPEEPTREGYKFIGWTLDGETYDFKTPVTGDLTLTAAYEELPYVVGKYALSLDNSFSINYYVDDLREGTNPADYTVSFDGGDEYTLTSSKRNEFKEVARVFANELLKEVSVVVKYKGEVVYEDAPSVRGYCDKAFAKYGHDHDVQLVLICEAALNYGSKAQQFAGDTGRLANDGEWFVAPGVDVPQASGYESGAATGITAGRSALTMGSTISLNLYAQHGRKALKSNYSFLVDGVRIDNEDVTDANNLYGVVIPDLFVTALDVEHSLTVIYHEGQSDQETFSYTISPNAYLYKANTTSASQVMRELAYYLYNYYAATTIPNVV